MDQAEQDIREVVREAQAGDSGSAGKLFDLFADRVFRFFRVRVSDVETAEDLTQTTFLEMIRSLKRYTEHTDAKFSTWLFQIARFRLIDHYRAKRPQVALEDVAESSHPSLVRDPEPFEFSTIDRVFPLLPERYQTVLHLRFREDLAPEEVARIMGTTTINVRVLQHRALKHLRKLLEGKQ